MGGDQKSEEKCHARGRAEEITGGAQRKQAPQGRGEVTKCKNVVGGIAVSIRKPGGEPETERARSRRRGDCDSNWEKTSIDGTTRSVGKTMRQSRGGE
ncbi:unnamed protein product [Calypogeia fissa]